MRSRSVNLGLQEQRSSQGDVLRVYSLKGRLPGLALLNGYGQASAVTKELGRALLGYAMARGRACMLLDLTDQDGQPKKFLPRATLGQWQQDLADLQPLMPPGPQVWVGASLGAWLMLLASRTMPEKFAAMLGIGAAFDWNHHVLRPALAQATRPEPGVWLLDHLRQGLAIPDILLDDLPRHRVAGTAWPLHCPLRLLHGTADDQAPLAAVEALLGRELPGERATLRRIDGAGHDLATLQGRAAVGILHEELDALFAQAAEAAAA